MACFLNIRRFIGNQRGGVFTTLFGAVALAGIIGAGTMALIQGPLSTAVQSNRMNAVDNYMSTTASIIMSRSAGASNDGDCDTDGYVEPLTYKSATSAPGGGGQLPDDIGVSKEDPWGTPYGYCAWDHGSTIDGAGCGGASQNRLPGTDALDETAVAIISAGKDQTFQTTCNAFSDSDSDGEPDTPLVDQGSGDDIAYARTYEEAAQGSGGLWKLATSSSDTAQLAKDAKVGEAGADFNTMQSGVLYANNGLVLGSYDLSQSPPQVPDCAPGNNDRMMVYDSDSNSTVICDASKGEWKKIAGTGGSNFPPAFTEGADADITTKEDTGPVDLTALLEANDLNTLQTLTWSVDTAPPNGQLYNFNKSKTAGIGVQPPGGPPLQYEPDPNYSGNDSFVIKVDDGNGGSATITINVNILADCDLPWGGQIHDGQSVTAYNTGSVYGCTDNCSAHDETRSCSDGTLSGSYTNQDCNTLSCTYSYTSWSGWSGCSASCGGGTKSRSRNCRRDHDGATVSCSKCGGNCTDYTSCNTHSCCVSYQGDSCCKSESCDSYGCTCYDWGTYNCSGDCT